MLNSCNLLQVDGPKVVPRRLSWALAASTCGRGRAELCGNSAAKGSSWLCRECGSSADAGPKGAEGNIVIMAALGKGNNGSYPSGWLNVLHLLVLSPKQPSLYYISENHSFVELFDLDEVYHRPTSTCHFLCPGRVCLVRAAALLHRHRRGQDSRAAVHRGVAESGVEAAGGVDEAGWVEGWGRGW